VLANAQKVATLEEAIADCQVVIGTSARPRHLAVPMLSSRELPDTLSDLASAHDGDLRVALVFGRERSGLNNHELDRCTHLVQIPVNVDFSSLNLGSAVQVLAYECARDQHGLRSTKDALPSGDTAETLDEATSDSAAMNRLFEHLETVMLGTGFLDPKNPKHLMRRLRQYFERNRPKTSEMNILRGFLTSIQRPMPKNHDD